MRSYAIKRLLGCIKVEVTSYYFPEFSLYILIFRKNIDLNSNNCFN